MVDQYKLISRRVQPTHYLRQSWLAGILLSFSLAKPTMLVIKQLYLYLQLAYKSVIKAHESLHVLEGLSAKIEIVALL